jgi:hypothetical protein
MGVGDERDTKTLTQGAACGGADAHLREQPGDRDVSHRMRDERLVEHGAVEAVVAGLAYYDIVRLGLERVVYRPAGAAGFVQ